MISKQIGLGCVVLHGMLYFWTIDQLVHTYDAQRELIWIPLVIVDFPVWLLAYFPGDWWSGYNAWLDHWNHPALSTLFSSQSLILGILGSLWWYFLPRLFLPSKWGGVW